MSKLTPSKQDYLEAILDLSVQGAPVRSIDVANALGFSRASVSRAIGLLRADGFLLQQPYGGDHPHRSGPPGSHKGPPPPRPAEILPDPHFAGAGGDRRGGRLPDGACGQLHHSGTDRSRRHPAYEGVSRRQIAICCPPAFLFPPCFLPYFSNQKRLPHMGKPFDFVFTGHPKSGWLRRSSRRHWPGSWGRCTPGGCGCSPRGWG